MSVLIKGGRVVTAADDYVADVFVEDETVTLIGESLDVQADRVIDAAGKMVLPGCIDPHTHLDMPFGGTTSCDDFTSGTVSAAFGGTTCHVDFCIQGKGQTFAEALETWHGKIESAKPVIDVGFHLAVTDLHEGGRSRSSHACPTRASRATSSSWPTRARSWSTTRPCSASCRRPPTPARSSWCTPSTATRSTSSSSRRSPRARPTRSGAHASARDRGRGHEPRRPARARGRLQPLRRPRLLQGVDRPDRPRQGARLGRARRDVHAVPLRRRDVPRAPRLRGREVRLHAAAAREGEPGAPLARGRTDILSVISTDHCPFRWADQKSLGRDDFSKIPNGGPGLEDRLMMIHEFGVRGGRISLNRMVELLSTNPAKYFGLYPRKGTVAVGSDADIVVFDPDKRVTLSAERSHSRVDYNLYEGGHRRAGDRPRQGQGDRRCRRARRPARRRAVRQARPLREQLTTAAGAAA